MFEELGAGFVDGGRGGVGLQGSRGELVREVFAGVEVFEEAGGCFEVVVCEVDGVVLGEGGGGGLVRLQGGGEVEWGGEGGGGVGLTGGADAGAIASAKKGDLTRRAWWAVSWVTASPEPMCRVTIGDLR